MLLAPAIKERALKIGFDLAGIAPISVWKDLAFSRQWVEKGFNGEMRYLGNPERFDPRLVLPSAKSVICVGLVYNAPLRSQESGVRSQTRSQESGFRSQETGDEVSGVECGVPGEECATGFRPPKAPAPSPQPLAPSFSDRQRTTDHGQPTPRAWISRYAWGRDYHEIMRARLEDLRVAIEALAPGVETRVFVDTGPVVERAFARFSGIGWMGKNTCIINQEKGSWFFLGVILTSLELATDLPAADRCGSCTACLDACPTGALVEPYVMDASRCISYFTIELRGSIPEQFRAKIGDNVFGCDICQDVCPWNSSCPSSVVRGPLSVVSCQSSAVSGEPAAFSDQQAALWQGPTPDKRRANKQAATTKVPEFHPLIVEPTQRTIVTGGQPGEPTTDDGQRTTDNGQRATHHGPQATDNGPGTIHNQGLRPTSFQFPVSSFSLFHPPLEALASISEEDFRRIFAQSPVKRAKYRGWLRNLSVAMGNSGDERFVSWLERAAQHSDPVVREHAAWALERLRGK
jgi:epoxyqueuosine reductase